MRTSQIAAFAQIQRRTCNLDCSALAYSHPGNGESLQFRPIGSHERLIHRHPEPACLAFILRPVGLELFAEGLNFLFAGISRARPKIFDSHPSPFRKPKDLFFPNLVLRVTHACSPLCGSRCPARRETAAKRPANADLKPAFAYLQAACQLAQRMGTNPQKL